MSGHFDKLSLLLFPEFLHILSVETAPFLLAWEVVYQPYVLHQGTLVPDTERGRRELLYSVSVICNPTAPPLQFPRAAPQPPSQPPELSACQAHQVLLLDHLGHDFLNLLVLPTNAQVPMHHTKACAWSLNTRSPSDTPARRCIFPRLPLLKACDSHHLC